MRRAIAIAVLLAGSIYAPCQSTFIVQFDSVQSGHDASGRSIMETENGLIVFAWQHSDDGTGRMRGAVYKLAPDGTFLSRYEIGTGELTGSYFGRWDPVTRMNTGGFASMFVRSNGYGYNIDMIRFDDNGDVLSFNDVMDSPPEDSIVVGSRQLRQTGDGGFVLCGAFSLPDGYAKALLVKLDSTGAVQWQRTYDAAGQSYDAISVAQYVDGGYVLAGYRLPQGLNGLGFLIRTDSAGNELWRRHFGNQGGAWCPVRVCADSGIVVLGSYAEPDWPWDWYQLLLVKYDAQGGLLWQTRCNYFQYVTAYDMEVLPDQSIITSSAYSSLIGLTKFSSAGDSLWCRWLWAMGTNSFHSAYDVELASDGGFLLTGQVTQMSAGNPHPGQETIFVIKTDSLGCVVPGCQNVGVQEFTIDLQEHLEVSPNPANDRVNVLLTLPETGEVEGQARVLLLDATGRTVLEQPMQRNLNQLRTTVEVSALPAGMYYLHLRDAKRWLAGSKVVVE